MAQVSFLKNRVLYSPLASQSMLRPTGKRGQRNVTATLMLTSLVDAFSILVIFLMMNSATEQSDFQVDKAITLPKAEQSVATYKTAVVKFVKNQMYVNDKAIGRDQLAGVLSKVREEMKAAGQTGDSLVIIADKEIEFSSLNPIIVAGSRVGFNEFKFAVERISK